MDIKPIETFYNGYRFRSRLEARWAVFFDALNVKYEYEPEGYLMSNEECYLPDFYLPDMNYYIEVKGKNEHLYKDIDKLKQFTLDKKTVVMILSNIPYDKSARGLFFFPIQYYSARSGGHVDGCRALWLARNGRGYIQDDFYIGCKQHCFLDTRITKHISEKRRNELLYEQIQALPGEKIDIEENNIPTIRDCFNYELISIESALEKARQARFEHGETPTI